MSTIEATDENCRLTVIAAALRVDLAVPVRMAVAELLSIVVSSLGQDAADRGISEGGWVLQRAAEDALDPSRSLAASRVRDGEVLYLRTGSARLAPAVFDDVLDAVATAVATRTSRWQPVHTMRMTAGFAAATLSATLFALVLIGPPWTCTSIVAGFAAVALESAALALGRGHACSSPAFVAAGFAVAYGVLGAATAVGGAEQVWRFGALPSFIALCAAAVLATVSMLVVGGGFAAFVAVTTASVLTAIGTGIAACSTLTAAGTAAVVATAALAVSPVLPALALRLSRLPLPAVPDDPAESSEPGGVDPRRILGQAVRADQVLTGLVGGVGIAIAGVAVLLGNRGPSETILAVVLALICLVRARLFTGTGQRAALLMAGAIAMGSVVLAGIAAGIGTAHGATRTLALAIPAVIVAVALLALTVTLPGRRHPPPLSRLADIVESLLVLSVVPLALAVMGVYGAVRALHPG